MTDKYFIIIQGDNNMHYAVEEHFDNHKKLGTFTMEQAKKTIADLQEKFPKMIKSYKFYKLRGDK